MAKKILIIGGWDTTHIRRFLKILCNSINEEFIIDAYDPRIDDNMSCEIAVNKVYRVPKPSFMKFVYRIRKIGTFLLQKKKEKVLSNILAKGNYDIVEIHQIPINALQYVRIAHRHKTKTLLIPFGSDVLRTPTFIKPFIKQAFKETDYVGLDIAIGFATKVIGMYHIDKSKLISLRYGSETISSVLKMKGRYSKVELADLLSIPYHDYYICCGYTASRFQHQALMIDAIYNNIGILPKDCCLIVPLTYGPDKILLINELHEKCKRYKIPVIFLTEYLEIDKVAALRCITDLMIHIQPTDAYNASLQEYLLAGSDVINGKWLDYPSLEIYGAPYYICDSLNDLSHLLKDVFLGIAIKSNLHKEIINEIVKKSWGNCIKAWPALYHNV